MIEIEHLSKKYGEHLAVDDLSFQVDSGQIYGFLGPNGAGKSTTMNIMTGCLSATEGHVRINGYDIFEAPDKAKRLIGYLPEQPPLYLSETPLEYLTFVGEAKGLRGGALKRQISDVVAQTGIESVQHRRVAALSKGFRQRVGIAQALLGDPEVIILDEPTVGLDPIQIIEIRDLIKALGQRHTVILSSHILSEVQAICDQILILSKGKLVAFGRPDELEKRLLTPGEIALTADASPEETQALLQGVEGLAELHVEAREDGFAAARLKTDREDAYAVSRAVFLAFAGSGRALVELAVKKASLEDVFLELTESDGPAAPADDPPAEEAPAVLDPEALDFSGGAPADGPEENEEVREP